jgi:hypothetical protein
LKKENAGLLNKISHKIVIKRIAARWFREIAFKNLSSFLNGNGFQIVNVRSPALAELMMKK